MTTSKFTVKKEEAGTALRSFLAGRMHLSHRGAKELLDRRVVFVNNRRTWMARHQLHPGDVVSVSDPAREPSPLGILWKDKACLVANKPPGILAVGRDSAENRLASEYDGVEWLAVHRLDRDTSGCMLFVASPEDKECLIQSFRALKVRKLYRALVHGRVQPTLTQITEPLDGKQAVTRWEVLDANRLASHLRIDLQTGRTHQIRKHLASIGHPIMGEKAYAGRILIPEDLRQVPRQLLHAAQLRFPHPRTGRIMSVSAPLPADFKRWLRKLKLK